MGRKSLSGTVLERKGRDGKDDGIVGSRTHKTVKENFSNARNLVNSGTSINNLTRSKRAKDVNGKNGKKNHLNRGNVFEARPNQRLKHEVLGRKLKGAKRNVAESLKRETAQRKSILLQEFRSRGKASTIVDRRFGENDATMSKEDKMLARLQRARTKSSIYNLDDNVLDSGNHVELTHRGRTLGDLLEENNGGDFNDEDEDFFNDPNLEDEEFLGTLGKISFEGKQYDAPELIRRFRNDPPSMDIANLARGPKFDPNNPESTEKKTTKQILDEVMMKSKLFKAARQREKEEDERETERLDELLPEIMKDSAVQIRPTREQARQQELSEMLARFSDRDASSNENSVQENKMNVEGKVNLRGTKGRDNDQEKNEKKELGKNSLDFDYDQTMRELTFEARASATNKSKTPEQIAKEERLRLEVLEEERLKRMNASYGNRFDDEDEDEDEEGEDGRRRKKKSHDKKLERESLKRTHGEMNSKEIRLLDLKKRRMREKITLESEIAEDGSVKKRIDSLSGDSDDDSINDVEEENNATGVMNLNRSRRNVISQDELPFVLEAPENHAQFLEIINNYKHAEIDIILERIMKSNSIHLKAENREKMNKLIQILIDHLVYMVEANHEVSQMDKLLGVMYDLTQEIPHAATAAFARRLAKMERSLEYQLRISEMYDEFGGDLGIWGLESDQDVTRLVGERKKGGHKGKKGRRKMEIEKVEAAYAAEMRGDVSLTVSVCRCWPTRGDFAFFKAISAIFPVTDFQHPVITPSQLLLCQYVSQCPVRGIYDLAAAITTNQILLDFTKDAKRLVPEVISSISCVMQMNCIASRKQYKNTLNCEEMINLGDREAENDMDYDGSCISLSILGCRIDRNVLECEKSLHFNKIVDGMKIIFKNGSKTKGSSSKRQSARKQSKKESKEELKSSYQIPFSWLDSERAIIRDDASFQENLKNMVPRMFLVLLRQIEILCDILEKCPSSDVLFLKIHKSLKELCVDSNWQGTVHTSCLRTFDKVDNVIEKCKQNRQYLQLQSFDLEPIKSIAPKLLSADKAWKKHLGTGSEPLVSQEKKLKAIRKRERKAVVRSLRRDGAFLAQERAKEKAEKRSEISESLRRNKTFLDSEAAEANKVRKELRKFS